MQSERQQMGKRELYDFAALVKGETEKGIKLFDGARTEWLPKKYVQNNEDGTWTIPVWLAEEKGFI